MFSHSLFWKIILGLLSASIHINYSISYTRFCGDYGFLGELNISGYKFCGPGTKILTKLHETPKDELDEACKQHELVYCNTNDINEHCKSDLALFNIAEWRKVADDATEEEKTAASFVSYGIRFFMEIRSYMSRCKCSVLKGGC